MHHAIFRILYQIFDKTFIFDAYSCRLNKGAHRAVNRLARFARRLSRNNHWNIYALKCDIKRFFDSIDQNILLDLIESKIQDENALGLIKSVIQSFSTVPDKGLPLGNVTSQLFANIYLNEFDQFIKHKLKIKYYLRYCDDFIILSEDDIYLQSLIPIINQFLQDNLQLQIHPEKIIIKKWYQGVDFLGYISFPRYFLLRTKTRKRIFKKITKRRCEFKNNLISEKSFNQTLQSYYGILGHCKGHKTKKQLYKLLAVRDFYDNL